MKISQGRLVQLVLLIVAAWTATYIRSAIGPLQETIRGALVLTDNQIALLQGMAVAVPIALGSVPVGMLADRVSRVRILLFSLLLALISFGLSAVAKDFSELLIARCLTGLATPGIIVSAYSLVGDLFAPGERGRATMAMAIGELGGAPAAFALGGVLLVSVGASPAMKLVHQGIDDWGNALLWMGAVLIPVLAVTLALREPPRTERVIQKPRLMEVWPELWRHRGVALPLQLARATVFIADGAVFVWAAPFFSRRFHLSADSIGATVGVVLLVGGLFGPALGGPLVDACQRHGGPRRAITILAGVALLSAPLAFFGFMTDPTWASVLMALFLVLGFTIAAAAMPLTLIVIPGELRGLNVGLSIVVGSLFFIGLAPLAVSGLSGLLGGEAKIGEALTIVCVVASLLNAAVLAFSARNFPRATQSLVQAETITA